MILAAIDTSTRWAGVGLRTGPGEQAEMVWRSEQNHGRELMPAIAELTGRAGLTPADITHLAVALGPGGFSAVRVGISTVIGLAMPNGLPVVGVSTHLLEAFPYLQSASAESPVISLLPAGRGEVSWARFTGERPEPASTGLSRLEEMLTGLPGGALVCGEAAESLEDKLPAERILSPQPPTRSPSALLDIAAARFDSGDVTPLEKLRPIYARPPSITVPRNPA